jgi:hypothetical protein
VSPDDRPSDRRWIITYTILTLVIVLPLLWAFRMVANVYPITSWTVMISGGGLQRGWTYYILTGETLSGERVDVRPARLTNALYGRTWGLVHATVENRSFRLDPLHPNNAELLKHIGGIDNLPPGARLPELLQAWGRLHNDRLPAASPLRLRAIQIDMYRWDSGRYEDYRRHITTWRQAL